MVNVNSSNKGQFILYAQDSSGNVVPVQASSGNNGINVDIVDSSGNSITSGSSLKVQQVGSNAILCDSYSVTTSASAIASSQSVQEVIVQADPDNTEDVFVGNSTNQTIQLLAGQSMTIPVDDIAKIYAKTNQNTATINYVGRGN